MHVPRGGNSYSEMNRHVAEKGRRMPVMQHAGILSFIRHVESYSAGRPPSE